MSLAAAYIVATSGERDPHEFVPEEWRRARAIPVYAAVRSLGRQGLAELIERNCRQARRFAEALRAAGYAPEESLRALPEVDLCFKKLLSQVTKSLFISIKEEKQLDRAVQILCFWLNAFRSVSKTSLLFDSGILPTIDRLIRIVSEDNLCTRYSKTFDMASGCCGRALVSQRLHS